MTFNSCDYYEFKKSDNLKINNILYNALRGIHGQHVLSVLTTSILETEQVSTINE